MNESSVRFCSFPTPKLMYLFKRQEGEGETHIH